MTSNNTVNSCQEHCQGTYRGEPDRAFVALGVAELHAQLGLLFQRNLRGDQRQLLGPDGALGGTSTRVQLAHALGWVDDNVRDDLLAVLSIQSDVARGSSGQSPFFDCIAADRCGALKLAANLLGDGIEDRLGVLDDLCPVMPPVDEAMALAARRRFEVTVSLLAKHIGALSVSSPCS